MIKIYPDSKSVLLVIDVQNDFLPGGSLAVPQGDEVIPVINNLAKLFDNVVLTQDWHPPNHVSFASSYRDKHPFDHVPTYYGKQALWPDHCVQGTPGAEIAKDLSIPHAQLILRKGYHHRIDSYSAFFAADHKTPTGLLGYLKERDIDTVFVAGLATDFCVAQTALDARWHESFITYVINDACRAIDTQGSLAAAWDAMTKVGVYRINSSDLSP
jgi:nicotinamidase/pyrazinamidase